MLVLGLSKLLNLLLQPLHPPHHILHLHLLLINHRHQPLLLLISHKRLPLHLLYLILQPKQLLRQQLILPPILINFQHQLLSLLNVAHELLLDLFEAKSVVAKGGEALFELLDLLQLLVDEAVDAVELLGHHGDGFLALLELV